MGLQPEIAKRRQFAVKTCNICGELLPPTAFAPTKSIFYKDGSLPICNVCVRSYLKKRKFSWEAANRLCQYVDIPWIPHEWERLRELNGDDVFPVYAQVFADTAYEDLGWQDYFDSFKKLKLQGALEDQLPGLSDKKREELRQRWGRNYDDEALDYLENLYNGLMTTQNVNGALQIDQALKICKISYEIDCRIREGADFDKILASYDKIVKTAEFTPRNAKNINDFDSCGELIKWLEKRGWRNKFYDDVTRDIVDETILNIQSFNQRLYTNESGIGDEITSRLNAIRYVEKVESENYYGTDINVDLDKYENDGYNALVNDEEFEADIGEDDNY